MATIIRREQERSNWCWAACIQMLLSVSDTHSQREIVHEVVERCPGGVFDGDDENVQMPRDSLACAFESMGLPATFEPGTPLAEDVLDWANRQFMAICFGSDPSDGHVVLVSGVSHADDENPVLVVIDPRHGAEDAREIPYKSLRIGAGFGVGGWDGTVVSKQ
jgi:hypothetical protein